MQNTQTDYGEQLDDDTSLENSDETRRESGAYEAVTDAGNVPRDDYKSERGIAAWWPKDGAWHIALPCADPDPTTGLRTGGFRWTAKGYSTRESAINAIELVTLQDRYQ
jgi:hypothetical protein